MEERCFKLNRTTMDFAIKEFQASAKKYYGPLSR